MNRITMNIDLDGNEMLEKEVLEAIQGYARKVARESLIEIIEAEAQRVIRAAFDNKYSALRLELEESLRNAVRQEISIAGFDHRFVRMEIRNRIDESAKQVLEEYKNAALVQLTKAVDESARNILQNEVGRIVFEALKKAAGSDADE